MAAEPAPFLLGQLIDALTRSEQAYVANSRTADRVEARDGSVVAQRWRVQASALLFRPDSASHPGIDKIEAICDEMGAELTATAVRMIRGKLCARLGIGTDEANGMPLNAVVDALKAKSSTPSAAGNKPYPDVLVVTVNKHETRAVLDAFRAATGREIVPRKLEGMTYHDLGSINGTSVYHALSEMGTAGLGAMLQTVDKAIRALDPGAVIAVGIAFGVNEEKQKVGEILVSKLLRLYEQQRRGSGGEITLRGASPDASPRLLGHFRAFDHFKWDGAKVRFGTVLSGEKLIDDVDYRDQLVQFEAEAEGGEMEGAGLYVSCVEHKVDWIVIKAICDWADGNKGKDKEDRQKLAAKNAASFLVESLTYVPLKRYATASGTANSDRSPPPAPQTPAAAAAVSGALGQVPFMTELSKRHLASEVDPEFLRTRFHKQMGILQDSQLVHPRKSAALFAYSPKQLFSPAGESEFVKWVDGNKLRYAPRENGIFIPSCDPCKAGSAYVWSNRTTNQAPGDQRQTRYIAIERAGWIEYGFQPLSPIEDQPYVFYARIVANTFSFLLFVRQVAERLGIEPATLSLGLAMRGIKGAALECVVRPPMRQYVIAALPERDTFLHLRLSEDGGWEPDAVAHDFAEALLNHWAVSHPGLSDTPEFEAGVYKGTVFNEFFDSW